MTTYVETAVLIEQARTLVGRSLPELAGIWQRATAFLARQALETVVREALDRRVPGAGQASARAQLLCLPSYVSTPVAQDASYLWSVLSRACHQHSYELAPTWEELADWLEGVERVAERLSPLVNGSEESAGKPEKGTSDERS